MRLGIDFGTTRTVVAVSDRGNYPVVTFEDTDGDPHSYVPSVVAEVDGRLVHGFEAERASSVGAPTLRSVKRILSAPDATADTPVTVGAITLPLLEVLTSYFVALRRSMRDASSLTSTPGAVESIDAHTDVCVAAVPAHAHSGQRMLTIDALAAAGFTVERLVNEPSAAGFEYTHHRASTLNAQRSNVLVFDLGGGTFDASLVSVVGEHHDVVASLGRADVGGDDFDHVLARVACEHAGVDFDALSPTARGDLLLQAREAKERIAPQSRRILLDVAGEAVTVPVDEFYARSEPLVEAAMETMAPLSERLQRGEHGDADVAGIYVVGGASSLPLIPRMLRERFGRRVHRSPVPSSSTAIGLAIAADHTSPFELRDRTSLGFGVFREADAGERVAFDPVFVPGIPIPDGDAIVRARRYRPEHNVGVYRFVEFSSLAEGHPNGLVFPAGDLRVPFDGSLTADAITEGVRVHRDGTGPLVEERFELDRNGIISVRVDNLDAGTSYVPALRRRGGAGVPAQQPA
ncbi:Hsp70 family protein [Pseudoclavibacter chungangensis]|uniref:Hsp70 family protein n=1 Tax=Pseudoclavibacter chungangensis TaxID=587635 RepID=A0A7J5C074_9MICO|nr:Hsp70 family protein [Pseudoclavibacter chungangensis]KAB1660166.1 Hsp70 family protein [Pseudoclavibacter chungangensis]NYJ66721.1 molecular chaperone DnaK (HSP70) [Pseudoclavibacter chungangensis]